MNLEKNLNFPNKIKVSNIFETDNSEWSFIFTFPVVCTFHNHLRDFHFKVTHKILWFNKLLHKTGVVETCMCSFCEQYEENRIQIFCKCEIVLKFLETFQRWWYAVTNINIVWSTKVFLLGYKPEKCDGDLIID